MKSDPRRLTILLIATAFALFVLLGLGQSLWSDADRGGGPQWILKKADNICGISEPRRITHPALVDFDRALAATPQMKKLREERIDPNSPQGVVLRSEAVALVRDVCVEVRRKGGYCGVWKKIARRDGGPVPNVTEEVLARVRAAKL